MTKTFWRMRLYETLCSPVLLHSVEVSGASVRFVTANWDEYWGAVPKPFMDGVSRLKEHWTAHIRSGFDVSESAKYSRSYFDLLCATLAGPGVRRRRNRSFVEKVLAFENFVLRNRDGSPAFAGATASFRLPAFLSLSCRGLRKNSRNDPSMLPLIVALDRQTPRLFYHYRKQRILKNCDCNLLFFPSADLESRAASFRGLDDLTEVLLPPWDSRIEQRSRLMSGKVLVPYLSDVSEEQATMRSLRILDIGSGVGLFTSKVLAALTKSNVLGRRKLELSLLDILSVDPKRHFQSDTLLASLGKVEYISSDFISWLERVPMDAPRFEFVFLFRILHNFSRFRIGSLRQRDRQRETHQGRYRVFAHMSDYYNAIAMLFPETQLPECRKTRTPSVRCPARVFNPGCLLLPNGQSVITRLGKLSRVTLIEDGDLTPRDLVAHLNENVKDKGLRVHDRSRYLRLSVNHVYWITSFKDALPLHGELIWPE